VAAVRAAGGRDYMAVAEWCVKRISCSGQVMQARSLAVMPSGGHRGVSALAESGQALCLLIVAGALTLR